MRVGAWDAYPSKAPAYSHIPIHFYYPSYILYEHPKKPL